MIDTMTTETSKPLLCDGCNAENAYKTAHGYHCPTCEAVLDRFEASKAELDSLVSAWLTKWRDAGLTDLEVIEHLTDVMSDVSQGRWEVMHPQLKN